jgi:hypothetical protein
MTHENRWRSSSKSNKRQGQGEKRTDTESGRITFPAANGREGSQIRYAYWVEAGQVSKIAYRLWFLGGQTDTEQKKKKKKKKKGNENAAVLVIKR